MSQIGAVPRAAIAAPGAPTRTPAPVSNARAEASRRNGARSRGPKSPEGKARSAQNALKHGMRAQKYVVLPDEDAVEFAELEAALLEELAPVGALQTVLARRVAIAAWRLARADRIETELFAEQRWDGRDLGLALIRDGNGTRSFETLMRYRGAAMAEFMRALRTLKALQAGEAKPIERDLASVRRGGAIAREPIPAPPMPDDPGPKELEPNRSGRGVTGWAANGAEPSLALREPPAPWTPNEPELREAVDGAGASRTPTRPGGNRRAKEPETRGNPGGITPQPAAQPLVPGRRRHIWVDLP